MSSSSPLKFDNQTVDTDVSSTSIEFQPLASISLEPPTTVREVINEEKLDHVAGITPSDLILSSSLSAPSTTISISPSIPPHINPEASALEHRQYLHLIREYAPIIYLHPKEPHNPCNIEYYLGVCDLYYGNLPIALKKPGLPNEDLPHLIHSQRDLDRLRDVAIASFYERYPKAKEAAFNAWKNAVKEGKYRRDEWWERWHRREDRKKLKKDGNVEDIAAYAAARAALEQSKTEISSSSSSSSSSTIIIPSAQDFRSDASVTLPAPICSDRSAPEFGFFLLCPRLPGPSDYCQWNLRVAECDRKISIRGLTNPNDAPIYARVRSYRSYYEIVYVFHYPYNGPYHIFGLIPAGIHDADFEHLVVRVRRKTREEIAEGGNEVDVGGEILHVWYGSHGYKDGYWATAAKNNKKMRRHEFELRDGTHPVIYIAHHSHAIYSHPSTYWRILGFANDVCVRDENSIWTPSEVVLIYDPSHYRFDASKTSTSWVGYRGHWCCDGISSVQCQGWWWDEFHQSNVFTRRCCTFCLPCGKAEWWFLKRHTFEIESEIRDWLPPTEE